MPSFQISSFPAQEKVVRNYSEFMKLYTNYSPHLLKSRGFRELVSMARATQWEKVCKGKKKEKENDPYLSPPELTKQLYILFRGSYTIRMAGASSAVSELKASWASRGFGGRCNVCASLACFSEFILHCL